VYNGDHPWRSFRSLFDWTYQEITGTIAPGKPMIIGEVASTGSGGSKARWITDMLDVLPAFRHLGGFLWWDSRTPGPGGHTDWPIESGRAAKAAFARGIWSPEYLSNNFARLEASPIPPPSR
jgi:hypothetical protein